MSIKQRSAKSKKDQAKGRAKAFRVRQRSKVLRRRMAKLSELKARTLVALIVMVAILSGILGLSWWKLTHHDKTNSPSRKPVAKQSLAIPYSKTVGFIGDSLTYGCCQKAIPAPTLEVQRLGSDYRAINRGANGSTTADWLDKLLEPALKEFKKNKVEVVQVMLGTNDLVKRLPTDEIVDHLREIADRVKRNGAKMVIVNNIPYSSLLDDEQAQHLNIRLGHLASERDVYIGDTSAYDYFRSHQEQLTDGTHMNQAGYQKLAELWSDALGRVASTGRQPRLTSPLSDYRSRSRQDLVMTLSKPAEWFYVSEGYYAGVEMDGETIDRINYRVGGTGDRTKLVIGHDYLDELKTGEHTIKVKFSDGTSVSRKFKIVKGDD